MNYVISKDFSFSAAHYLNGLDEEHPCSRMHGHNYIVRVELISDTLNAIGFVVDYRDLSPIKDWLCLLYTSPSPRDGLLSRMPSSA